MFALFFSTFSTFHLSIHLFIHSFIQRPFIGHRRKPTISDYVCLSAAAVVVVGSRENIKVCSANAIAHNRTTEQFRFFLFLPAAGAHKFLLLFQ